MNAGKTIGPWEMFSNEIKTFIRLPMHFLGHNIVNVLFECGQWWQLCVFFKKLCYGKVGYEVLAEGQNQYWNIKLNVNFGWNWNSVP